MYSRKDIDRFHDSYIPEPMSGCFLWAKTSHVNGYGCFRYGSTLDGTRGQKLAHRVSCELAYGPIPAGMQALHKCDNKACVNPAHLYIGTHDDNMRDAAERHLMKGVSLKGEINPKSKLRNEDVLTIRASKEKIAALAEKYGVCKVTISDIRRRKTWRHLGSD